jgi:hypothetical protein
MGKLGKLQSLPACTTVQCQQHMHSPRDVSSSHVLSGGAGHTLAHAATNHWLLLALSANHYVVASCSVSHKT